MRLKIYWQFYAFVSLGFLVMTLLQICRRVLWHEFFLEIDQQLTTLYK